MCKPPKYCSFCLKRMQTHAIKKNDIDRANQLTSVLLERKKVSESPQRSLRTIDLSSIKGKIGIDCDDTIGSFEDDMRAAFAKRDGLTYEQALKRYPPLPPGGVDDWFDGDVEYSYSQYLDVEAKGLLYKDQPVREGAGETINWIMKKRPGQAEIITARPAAFNHVTAAWLHNTVGVMVVPPITNEKDKAKDRSIELMIDDSVPVIKSMTDKNSEHGLRQTIFMTRPRTHKLIPESDHVVHAWSWNDVKAILGYHKEQV